MSEKSPMFSHELRGSLLKKEEPIEPKLTGTLLASEQKSDKEPQSLEHQTFIQRDGSQEYTVKSINPETDRIILLGPEGRGAITLSLSDFKNSLAVEGSPWSIK